MNSTGFFTSFEVEHKAKPGNPVLEICLSATEGDKPLSSTLTAFMSVDTLNDLHIEIGRLLDSIPEAGEATATPSGPTP